MSDTAGATADAGAPAASSNGTSGYTPNITADELFESYGAADDAGDDGEAPPKVITSPDGKADPGSSKTKTKTFGEQKTEEKTEADPAAKGKEGVDFKTIKAEVDGKQVDIPEKGLIKAKVNGKDVAFTVADAVKSHVELEKRNRDIDRHAGEVNFREQKHKASVEQARSNLGEIVKAAKTGNITLAFRIMAKMAGQDPVKFEQEAYPQMINEMSRFQKLTDTEKKLYWKERENEYLTESQRATEAEKTRATQMTALERSIQETCQKAGMTEDLFYERYNGLAEHVRAGKVPAIKGEAAITPEHVADWHQSIANVDKAVAAISAVSEEKAGDDRFLSDIIDIVKKHPEFTVEDVTDIIRQILGGKDETSQALNRKVSAAKKFGGDTQSGQAGSKGKSNDYDDGDLDFLYRKSVRAPRRR